MTKNYEGGIQPNRLEFVRESSEGVTPSNPSWNLYSDNARTVDPTIDPQVEGQEGLGSADFQDHFAGTRNDQLTIAYDLQQWFVDGSSNAQDAAYDALQRTAEERIPNTHSVVRRMDQSSLDASNTVNGSTSKDTRQYLVGKGGKANVTITGDSTSAQPAMVELEYSFEVLQPYQIDQPGSSTQLDVASSSSNDTSQTLTIEDEGNSTSEDVSLNGTTTQTTTASFGDIDAAELSAETEGDITISENGGDDLMVIRGTNSFDVGDGQLGVPSLGSGSHASALGSSYELFLDDTIERPNGTSLSDEINTVEFSVDNNLSQESRGGTDRPAVIAGGRDPSVSGTVFGEHEYFDKTLDMLRTTLTNLEWDFDGGTLTLDNAAVMDTSGSEEARQTHKEVDVTFEGEGVSIS